MPGTLRSAFRTRNDEADSYLKILLRMGGTVALFLGFAQLYVYYVSVYFAYYGFAYSFIPTRLPIALLVISALSLFLRPRISEITVLLAALCHLFFLIPTAVMFVFAGLFSTIFLWTAVIQATLVVLSSQQFKFNWQLQISQKALYQGLLVIGVSGLAVAIYLRGIFSFGFNIFEIYERRSEANVADIGLLGYLQQMGAQASLLLTAVAFFNRRYLMTLAGFITAVMFFAYTGHKSTVFWALFMIGFLYLSRFKNKFSYLLLGSVFFVWFVAIIIETPLGAELGTFLIRRTVFTPVLLNHYYMMFAEQFGFLDWSYSKVGLGLFEYTDTVSPTQAVGHYLTGSDTNSANTGLIGFGFINAGHVGVALYLVIFVGLLILATGLARQKKIEVLGAALLVRSTYFALTTSDLPATVLSGGLGYALIVLALYPGARVVRPASAATQGRAAGGDPARTKGNARLAAEPSRKGT